jgi:hypothetical protein
VGRQAPASAADVRSAIGGDLAYNTVQTILIRLHDKIAGCLPAIGVATAEFVEPARARL